MTATPWGEAETLRERRLTPGPGRSREEVLVNQRERLMGATVAVVAQKGYEATRVADLLETAGVSRNAFYKQFSSKQDCFLATIEALVELTAPAVIGAYGRTDGSWEAKLAAILDALAALVIAQPAAARVGWVEVHAAGPEAVAATERMDRKIEDALCRILRDSPERTGMPRDIVRAMVGGVRKIVHTRLREGREDELPALMPKLVDWMLFLPRSAKPPAPAAQGSRRAGAAGADPVRAARPDPRGGHRDRRRHQLPGDGDHGDRPPRSRLADDLLRGLSIARRTRSSPRSTAAAGARSASPRRPTRAPTTGRTSWRPACTPSRR